MRTRLVATIAIIALALAACGGDDDGGGNPQDQVADMMIEVLDDVTELEGVEGVEIDEGCIRDKVGELSDEDAQAILDAGPEGDPDVSDEADAIGEAMVECVDMSGVDLGELDTDG
jgi:hypothetical protein